MTDVALPDSSVSSASPREATGSQDRVAAEILIRSSALALANGAPLADIDEIVRRNVGNVSHADVMAGRLNTSVIGDIVNTVELAKGNKPFNWSAATQAEIKAYLTTNGIKFHDQGRFGLTVASGDKDGPASRESSAASSNIAFSSVTERNYAHSSFATTGLSYENFNSLRAQGFNEQNILHAAQDTRANGFDTNNKKMATAFATLDKEDGKRRKERNRLLRETDERMEHDEKFQNLKALRDQSQGAQRAAYEQQMMARGREINAESGLRKHFEAAPTPAARQAGKAVEEHKIKLKGAIGEYSQGNRAENERVSNLVADMRRNPEDPKVRKDYSSLPQNPTNSRAHIAASKIHKEVKAINDIAEKKIADNKMKVEENEVKGAENAVKATGIAVAQEKLEDDSDWTKVAEVAPSNKKMGVRKENKSKSVSSKVNDHSTANLTRAAQLKKAGSAVLKV